MIKPPYTENSLMHVHCENEYEINGRGKILSTNHWSKGAPASFLFVRTRTSNRWYLRHDIPSQIAKLLVDKFRIEPLGFTEPLVFADFYNKTFDEVLSERESFDSWVFCQKKPNSNIARADDVVQVVEANAIVLRRYFPEMLGYEGRVLRLDVPIFAKLVRGDAVSVCNSARASKRGMECYISTAMSHRGMGYGREVTNFWARYVHNTKKLPFLNTTTDNRAAIKIAQSCAFEKIGRVFRMA